MSGSGTNLIKLLEFQAELEEKGSSPFEVVFIFSDRSDGKSRGEAIALAAGIPYFSHDIRAFHARRGLKRSVATAEGLATRREYDRVAGRLIKAFGVDVIALGGYMSFITLGGCVNVHPADLSLENSDGSRRFVGDDAVLDAILAGRTELCSSTLWTDQGVDSGPLLMISKGLAVELPAPLKELRNNPDRLRKVVDDHQERLKQVGDWVVFPRTINLIASGRLALDEKGLVYLDGQVQPGGIRL